METNSNHLEFNFVCKEFEVRSITKGGSLHKSIHFFQQLRLILLPKFTLHVRSLVLLDRHVENFKIEFSPTTNRTYTTKRASNRHICMSTMESDIPENLIVRLQYKGPYPPIKQSPKRSRPTVRLAIKSAVPQLNRLRVPFPNKSSRESSHALATTNRAPAPTPTSNSTMNQRPKTATELNSFRKRPADNDLEVVKNDTMDELPSQDRRGAKAQKLTIPEGGQAAVDLPSEHAQSRVAASSAPLSTLEVALQKQQAEKRAARTQAPTMTTPKVSTSDLNLSTSAEHPGQTSSAAAIQHPNRRSNYQQYVRVDSHIVRPHTDQFSQIPITSKLEVGSKPEIFIVDKVALETASPYLKRKFVSEDTPIELKDIDANIFTFVLEWIHTGQIKGLTEVSGPNLQLDLTTMFRIFALAKRLEIVRLQDMVMTAVKNHYVKSGKLPTSAHILEAYRETPQHPAKPNNLRMFMISAYNYVMYRMDHQRHMNGSLHSDVQDMCLLTYQEQCCKDALDLHRKCIMHGIVDGNPLEEPICTFHKHTDTETCPDRRS